MSPLGLTLNETWSRLLQGESGLAPLPERYTFHVKSKNAYPIKGFWPSSSRSMLMAEVVIDDLLDEFLPPGTKIDALCIGSTSSSFHEVEIGLDAEPNCLVKALGSRYEIPKLFQVSQACSSSSYAIALGVDMIRLGVADVVLAGGADELTSCVISAFESVRLHVERCTPFDLDRKGLVLGEAASFVLLAKDGIGNPSCYIDGIGLTCDAMDSVAPSDTGISRAIEEAMWDAKTNHIDFVVAHGTGTKLNDITEAKAISRSCSLHPPIVSSYKGSLGHPQGASGAVGVSLAVKSLQYQVAFPTTGFTTHDPEIDVNVKVNEFVRRMPIHQILCLSSGSWGTNAAIIITKAEVQRGNKTIRDSNFTAIGGRRDFPTRSSVPKDGDARVLVGRT